VSQFFTDDQIRFLRHALDVLTEDVESRRLEIVARDRWGGTPPLDEIDEAEEVYLGPLRELFDKVQGLGHKLVIVGLASLVETTIRLMLAREAPKIAGPLGVRAGYGTIKNAFAQVWGRSIDTSSEYAFASLVRALGNDFKHRAGFAELPVPGNAQPDTFKVWQKHQTALLPDFAWGRHVNPTDGKIDFGALPLSTYVDHIERFLDDVQHWRILNPSGLVLK